MCRKNREQNEGTSSNKKRRTTAQKAGLIKCLTDVCRMKTMTRDEGSTLFSKGEYIIEMRQRKGWKKSKSKKEWKKLKDAGTYDEMEDGEYKLAIKKATELNTRDGMEFRRRNQGDNSMEAVADLSKGLKGFQMPSIESLTDMIGGGSTQKKGKKRKRAEPESVDSSSTDVDASEDGGDEDEEEEDEEAEDEDEEESKPRKRRKEEATRSSGNHHQNKPFYFTKVPKCGHNGSYSYSFATVHQWGHNIFVFSIVYNVFLFGYLDGSLIGTSLEYVCGTRWGCSAL